jgi:hypothetical protein
MALDRRRKRAGNLMQRWEVMKVGGGYEVKRRIEHGIRMNFWAVLAVLS